MLENEYEVAADMFDRYLNLYMTDNDRNTLEFIAKEYYDYLITLMKIGNESKFELEKKKALDLPDEPLNLIWKEKIKKLII